VTAERTSGGEYTSVQDFVSRVPLPALNKRTIESLFKSGAFDRFGHTRRALIEVHEKVVDDATREKKDASKGDVGFDFGELFDQPVELIPDRPEWPRKTKLEFEREMLGLYVSDHPLNGQEVVLQRHRTLYVSDLIAVPKVAENEGEETEWELQGASEDDVITLTGLLRNIEQRRVPRESNTPRLYSRTCRVPSICRSSEMPTKIFDPCW
jgi:DNA polymerase-3 subunit alpha